MKTIEIIFTKDTKIQLDNLTKEGKRRVKEIKNELLQDPYKTEWPEIYQFEILKHDTYKGLPVRSLRLSNRDRFCYSIRDRKIIEVFIVQLKGHYTGLSEEIKSNLMLLKSRCDTQSKRIAFNRLLESFKFDE